MKDCIRFFFTIGSGMGDLSTQQHNEVVQLKPSKEDAFSHATPALRLQSFQWLGGSPTDGQTSVVNLSVYSYAKKAINYSFVLPTLYACIRILECLCYIVQMWKKNLKLQEKIRYTAKMQGGVRELEILRCDGRNDNSDCDAQMDDLLLARNGN